MNKEADLEKLYKEKLGIYEDNQEIPQEDLEEIGEINLEDLKEMTKGDFNGK